jgi:NADPH-dependent glutamate synthase beta subunit-like oxidoreductase
MKAEAKTIAIIGGGHNGLTAAAYLAAQGFAVEVFEKRQAIGGLCVNETPFIKEGSQRQSFLSSLILRHDAQRNYGRPRA